MSLYYYYSNDADLEVSSDPKKQQIETSLDIVDKSGEEILKREFANLKRKSQLRICGLVWVVVALFAGLVAFVLYTVIHAAKHRSPHIEEESTPIMMSVTCENEIANIVCKNKIIRILTAFYGRTSRNVCDKK